MSSINYSATKCDEETPSEPGSYRLEDIRRTYPITREELLKREADIRREVEEQVRAEIRREMEQKQRAEQELQRQLAKQKQKEREEQKQLDELHTAIRIAERMESKVPAVILSSYDGLIASGHTLLIWTHFGTGDMYAIVTNKGVFRHVRHILRVDGQTPIYEELICPMYTFTKPLDIKQSMMMLNLSAALHSRKLNGMIFGASLNRGYGMDPKMFESVIRLIPGSYSNGSWKQLDGFFGAYINEETMEIMAGPPTM